MIIQSAWTGECKARNPPTAIPGYKGEVCHSQEAIRVPDLARRYLDTFTCTMRFLVLLDISQWKLNNRDAGTFIHLSD